MCPERHVNHRPLQTIDSAGSLSSSLFLAGFYALEFSMLRASLQIQVRQMLNPHSCAQMQNVKNLNIIKIIALKNKSINVFFL